MLMLQFSDNLGAVAASADVKLLQQALKNISVVAKYPPADPGAVDGIIGTKTLAALANIANTIPGMPSAVKDVIKLLPTVMAILQTTGSSSTVDQIKSAVTQYAKQISVAINAYSLRYTIAGGSTLPPPGAAGGEALYPAGTIARWHKQKKVYYIYAPGGTVSGLGSETPPPPNEVLTYVPKGVKLGQDIDEGEFYTKGWFWGAVAGGVAVLGVGGYLIFKK